MGEELDEHDHEAAVSEQPNDEFQEDQQDGQKMVPLSAMIATRKKAQEAEERALKAEAAAQVYQQYLNKMSAPVEEQEQEDPNALVERQHLVQNTAHTKRDILETLYQDMNPEAVQKINKYLKPILDKKPWLATSVDTAQNRYARAYEIVQDYMHLVEEKPLARQLNNQDGRRMVENAHKPRSPAEVGKSSRPEGVEYLKSIQGKKEFRDYRQKLLQGGY